MEFDWKPADRGGTVATAGDWYLHVFISDRKMYASVRNKNTDQARLDQAPVKSLEEGKRLCEEAFTAGAAL